MEGLERPQKGLQAAQVRPTRWTLPLINWLAGPLTFFMCSNAGGYIPLKQQGSCKDYTR